MPPLQDIWIKNFHLCEIHGHIISYYIKQQNLQIFTECVQKWNCWQISNRQQAAFHQGQIQNTFNFNIWYLYGNNLKGYVESLSNKNVKMKDDFEESNIQLKTFSTSRFVFLEFPTSINRQVLRFRFCSSPVHVVFIQHYRIQECINRLKI